MTFTKPILANASVELVSLLLRMTQCGFIDCGRVVKI